MQESDGNSVATSMLNIISLCESYPIAAATIKGAVSAKGFGIQQNQTTSYYCRVLIIDIIDDHRDI
jgi:hypothetical protein